MPPNDVDPNRLQAFIRNYRNQAHGNRSPLPANDAGFDPTTPRWAPWPADDIVTNAAYSRYAESNYTASTVSAASTATRTMRSPAPSVFSDHSRYGRSSMVSSAPSLGPPVQTFAEFAANGHQNASAQAHAAAPTGSASFLLWCEFCGLEQCDAVFRGDMTDDWIDHHERHLRGRFPNQLMCWFCDHIPFVANNAAERPQNFRERMDHIRTHIFYDHFTRDDMRPDFHIYTHMRDLGLIDESTYRRILEYNEVPEAYRLPGTRPGDLPPRPLGQQEESRDHWQRDLDREIKKERKRQREQRRQRR